MDGEPVKGLPDDSRTVIENMPVLQHHFLLSAPVHIAWWAHMRRFLSVCLSRKYAADTQVYGGSRR